MIDLHVHKDNLFATEFPRARARSKPWLSLGERKAGSERILRTVQLIQSLLAIHQPLGKLQHG